MLQLFPLISDVTMCDNKYPDPEEGSSKKMMPLSSYEMRKVLEEVEEVGIGEEERCEVGELEEENEFSRVLAEMPDLEGDYGDLSLGFNEELCFGPALSESDQSKAVSITTEKKPVQLTVAEKVSSETTRSPSLSTAESTSQDGEGEERGGERVSAVPIHRGDLIEFMITDRTWFLVEVTGRGKLGGKNQNYLNVRYSDGSEGGVYIDKHEWRIVKRKDLDPADSPEQDKIRLHRVTVDLPPLEEFSTETETTTTDDDEAISGGGGGGGGGQDKQRAEPTRKRKRSRRKREKERKTSVDESVLDTTNSISSIKRGDQIEYIVKEEDGKVRARYVVIDFKIIDERGRIIDERWVRYRH